MVIIALEDIGGQGKGAGGAAMPGRRGGVSRK